MGAPLVEILAFEGCPNRMPAVQLVEQVSRELQLEAEIRLVDVRGVDSVHGDGFAGSPTIRVDGADIDPNAQPAWDSVSGMCCRIFRTDAGPAGLPDSAWLRTALERAARTRAGGKD